MSFVEVYRSPLFSDCDQRAFVLKAVGIEYLIEKQEDFFVLLAPQTLAATAAEHLRQYDSENRPAPLPAKIPVYQHAWLGSIIYAAVVLAVAYCAADYTGGFDWLDAGALTRAAFYDNEWWRTATALTLHVDVAHLIGNLVFGIPYGFFASQLLGGGRAWLTILAAAVLANLIDSSMMAPNQSSIGASTAVFAMLGLVAAYSWRKVPTRSNRWAHRFAPIIAAIALLAFTGAGGENTDVIAHLAGFGCGALLALVHAALPSSQWRHRNLQVLAGAGAFIGIVAAWAIAATSIASQHAR